MDSPRLPHRSNAPFIPGSNPVVVEGGQNFSKPQIAFACAPVPSSNLDRSGVRMAYRDPDRNGRAHFQRGMARDYDLRTKASNKRLEIRCRNLNDFEVRPKGSQPVRDNIAVQSRLIGNQDAGFAHANAPHLTSDIWGPHTCLSSQAQSRPRRLCDRPGKIRNVPCRS